LKGLGSRPINATDTTPEIFVSGQALGPPWTGRQHGTSNTSGRENLRVPLGLGENGRLMRRKTRPYSRYAHRFSPVIRPFSQQARLAGLMGLHPSQTASKIKTMPNYTKCFDSIGWRILGRVSVRMAN
jgi:hypothetical protein